MPCSRCGKSVEWSNDVHWKSLGCLKVGEWDLVCDYKGFPSNAFSTVVNTHTWVALCDYCFDFRGGWREYVGRVASERAAEYHCATRAEGVAAWNKAFGAPGLSVKKEVEAADPGHEPTVYHPKCYEPTTRDTPYLNRQRYTIWTSTHSDSPLASDALPPLGVLFKAAPKSQAPGVLAAANIEEPSVNCKTKGDKTKGHKGDKGDNG
jgi:hypothetical protein